MDKNKKKYAKAFTNLVISVISYKGGQSLTALSESPLFRHQDNSIRDGIAGIGTDQATQRQTMQQARKLCLSEIDLTDH